MQLMRKNYWDTIHNYLRTAEPVIALIFPIAARIIIGDENLSNVFWIFIAQLGRHAKFHRVAIFGWQRFIFKS